MAVEITEEEVFDNDKDPLEAIREIRREEGVPEEDLPEHTPDVSETDILRDQEEEAENGVQEQDGAEEDLDAGQEEDQVDDDPAKEVESKDAADSGDESDSDGTTTGEEDPEKETGAEEDKGPVGRTFRANGQDFTFTEDEILEQFETVFGQAMNYTQKMQKIAPYRKMISALEQEGITHDSLNIAIDALKGDKGAIKQLLEQNKLDAYDLTSDDESSQPYMPKNYGKDETQLDIEEITSRIQGDEEFKITTNVIDDQWDDESRRMIAQNPRMIEGLHNDIKTGLYDHVAPAAMKMKVLDGHSKSDIEYYMIAGQQFAQKMEQDAKAKEGQKTVDELNAEAQGADSKFDKASSEAARKRSASSTGARADRKGVIDYLDDDDEAYEEWYKNLHSSV